MTEETIVWSPDKSYDECLEICRELGLIEIVQHGEHTYGRINQSGVNVFFALMQMMQNSSNPENKLKQT